MTGSRWFANQETAPLVIKRMLVTVLSVALVSSGVPPVLADQSAAVVSYIDNDGELFRLDYSDFANVQMEDVASGPASWSVVLDHAVFPGGASPPEYFVFSDPVEDSPFVDLGTDATAAAQAVGEDITTAAWEQVVRLDITSTQTDFVLRYTTPADYLELTYPKSFLLEGYPEDPNDVVSIDVNGVVATLSRTLFSKLGSGDPDKIEPMLPSFPQSVSDATAALVDPDGLMNVVSGLEHITLVTKRTSGDVTQGCFGICMQCAGALILYGTSLAGIVLACGSALVTGGSTALLCILSFAGAVGAGAVAIGSCVDCGNCGSGSCPCGGQPACSCG